MSELTHKPAGDAPAFPASQQDLYAEGMAVRQGFYEPGLLTRDYFAARAPAEPQAWFEPVMATAGPDPKAEPNWRSLMAQHIDANGPSDRTRRYAQSWAKDPCWDPAFTAGEPFDSDRLDPDMVAVTEAEAAFLNGLPAKGSEYADLRLAYDRAVAAHALEVEKQRRVQWPWAWADAVLAARNPKAADAPRYVVDNPNDLFFDIVDSATGDVVKQVEIQGNEGDPDHVTDRDLADAYAAALNAGLIQPPTTK